MTINVVDPSWDGDGDLGIEEGTNPDNPDTDRPMMTGSDAGTDPLDPSVYPNRLSRS